MPVVFSRLEVTPLYRCNAVCQHCNRAIGLAKFADGDMTVDQATRAVDRMIEQNLPLKRITIGGTEPVLHPDLPEFMKQFGRMPNLRLGRVLTNDMSGPKTSDCPEGKTEAKRRSLEPLPKPWAWDRAPLDDPEDPKSGKHKHRPFFWSPQDLGLESWFKDCRVKGWCGKGLDAFGWSMCGVAGTLGRLLRIDPYTRAGASSKEAPGICRHCPYGLSRTLQSAVTKTMIGHGMSDDEKHETGMKLLPREKRALPDHLKGAELPMISETYQKGFEQHRRDPMEFERL